MYSISTIFCKLTTIFSKTQHEVKWSTCNKTVSNQMNCRTYRQQLRYLPHVCRLCSLWKKGQQVTFNWLKYISWFVPSIGPKICSANRQAHSINIIPYVFVHQLNSNSQAIHIMQDNFGPHSLWNMRCTGWRIYARTNLKTANLHHSTRKKYM